MGAKGMARIHYRIVAHDGGWAYKLNDVFRSHFLVDRLLWRQPGGSLPSNVSPAIRPKLSTRTSPASGIASCRKGTTDRMWTWLPEETVGRPGPGASYRRRLGPVTAP